MVYSADWKLFQEPLFDNWSEFEPGVVDRHTQYVWGVRGSNDALMYRVDTNGDGDFAGAVDKTYYEVTDTLGSVIALLDSTGVIVQRTTYDAYGRARAFRPADLNGDGMVDDLDHGILMASWSPTHTHVHIADLNRDGVIDTLDQAILEADFIPGAAAGQIALPGIEMTIGYAGYIFNPELQIYSVGFRHYDPILGRWLERDPAGYVDGMSLYLYVMGNPLIMVDPWGLEGFWAEYWQRTKNGFIGAGAGAATGAGVGAGTGAVVGVFFAGVGAAPGALAGAGAGAIGGGIGGFISGFMAPPNATAGSVAMNGAIGGVAAGLSGGVTGPIAGAMAGTGSGALATGGQVALAGVSVSAGVEAGGVVAATAATIKTSQLPNETEDVDSWEPTTFAEGKLDEHFEKHASEWGEGTLSREQYVEKARSLLSSKCDENILGFQRSNGDVLRYNVQTNEFAVGSRDGTIRTLFKPHNGLDYWKGETSP